MSNDDWYRNTTWNSNIEIEFEARLKRSRGGFNKAQYLRIQASYLLGSSDNATQSTGIKLMERLVSDYPTETFSAIFGQEQLGDYYLSTGQYDKAEKYFREVVNHYKKTKSRGGTSATADLKLAETILIAGKTDKFVEAYNICKDFPLDLITFNSEKFYYAALIAMICNRINKKEEAIEFAKTALEISKITESQFNRHKTVGLVNASETQIQALESIINE